MRALRPRFPKTPQTLFLLPHSSAFPFQLFLGNTVTAVELFLASARALASYVPYVNLDMTNNSIRFSSDSDGDLEGSSLDFGKIKAAPSHAHDVNIATTGNSIAPIALTFQDTYVIFSALRCYLQKVESDPDIEEQLRGSLRGQILPVLQLFDDFFDDMGIFYKVQPDEQA